jgi:hypothetical protein
VTVIVALNGVLASDSGCVRRDFATGTGQPTESVGKLHELSDRIGIGSFGLSWWPGGSVQAVAGETRRAIAASSPPSVGNAVRVFAENLHRACAWMLRDIAAQRWPVPPGVEVGERGWCGFAGGFCVGYGPDDECAEGWFFCVTADEIEEPVLKYRVKPGGWGVAISPGGDHAYAAYRRIIGAVGGPRNLDQMTAMAAAITQKQIDGWTASPTPGGSYAGPVRTLALVPGSSPIRRTFGKAAA